MISVLGILSSPVTRYVGVAIAALAFVSWQRHDAASEATQAAEMQCEATFRERVDTEVERQRLAAETVLDQARERLEQSEEEATRLQEQADELLETLDGMGEAGSCPLDDDVRRRLLEIR